jgi:hypothetical protein
MELLGSSRCINGGRERRALVCIHRSEPLGKKREPLWRTWSLKCGSAGVRHCLSPGAALPHPPRQQKMRKVELTILSEV